MQNIFSPQEYFQSSGDIFQSVRALNEMYWPFQIIMYALGIAAVAMTLSTYKHKDKMILGFLSALWFSLGILSFIFFNSRHHPIYSFVGVAFSIQAIFFLLLFYGIGSQYPFTFSMKKDLFSITGLVFIFYGLIIYPVIGNLSGHFYPESPVFGIAPCPSCVFTFGMLLLAKNSIPWYMLLIPFIWSILGYIPVKLGVYADVGKIVVGLVGTILILIRNIRFKNGIQA